MHFTNRSLGNWADTLAERLLREPRREILHQILKEAATQILSSTFSWEGSDSAFYEVLEGNLPQTQDILKSHGFKQEAKVVEAIFDLAHGMIVSHYQQTVWRRFGPKHDLNATLSQPKKISFQKFQPVEARNLQQAIALLSVKGK